MDIIRSSPVLGLVALLVLAPVAAALAAPPVRDTDTVRLEQTVLGALLADECGFPQQIQIIGASKLRTWLVAARRVLTLVVVDWAAGKQLLPFSITLVWLPVRGVDHVSGSFEPVGVPDTSPLALAAAHPITFRTGGRGLGV